MTNNSTDTPRTDAEIWEAVGLSEPTPPYSTDACPHCGAEYFTAVKWECGTTPIIDGDTHRSPLCREREARQNAEDALMRTQIEMQVEIDTEQAEVERLKACLWQAVEIAEDLSSGDAWKFTSAEEKLDALKSEIKATLNTTDNRQMTTTDTPRTDACPQCGDDHPSQHLWGFCCMEGYMKQLEAEVKRLKALFNKLVEEVECGPECVSRFGDHCNCGRLKRANKVIIDFEELTSTKNGTTTN